MNIKHRSRLSRRMSLESKACLYLRFLVFVVNFPWDVRSLRLKLDLINLECICVIKISLVVGLSSSEIPWDDNNVFQIFLTPITILLWIKWSQPVKQVEWDLLCRKIIFWRKNLPKPKTCEILTNDKWRLCWINSLIDACDNQS